MDKPQIRKGRVDKSANIRQKYLKDLDQEGERSRFEASCCMGRRGSGRNIQAS